MGGEGHIFLDEVTCQGNESSLLECKVSSIGEHNCDHTEDAGVRCGGMRSSNCKDNFML